MEFDYGLYTLSQEFYKKYPNEEFSEILSNSKRVYSCIIVNMKEYWIAIPYRTNISHRRTAIHTSYVFRNTKRSKTGGSGKSNRSGSGLDYSKIVLLNRDEYINWNSVGLIDQDEFKETRLHIHTIVEQALKYIEYYVAYQQGLSKLSYRENQILFQYTSLKYFHHQLGLPEIIVPQKRIENTKRT